MCISPKQRVVYVYYFIKVIFGWIVCRASYTTLNEDNLLAHHMYPVAYLHLLTGKVESMAIIIVQWSNLSMTILNDTNVTLGGFVYIVASKALRRVCPLVRIYVYVHAIYVSCVSMQAKKLIMAGFPTG